MALLEAFADKSINHFFQFVKGKQLNEEGLLAEGLNQKQIEILRADFTERGLLSVPKVEEKPARKKKE